MPKSPTQYASPFLVDLDPRVPYDSQGRLVTRQSGLLTFARADASACATAWDRNGLLVTAPPGYLRREMVDLDGDGIRETPSFLMEEAATNDLGATCRDLTTASWTRTTMTAAPVRGADGVAGSGTRLTATAGNATVIRAAALVHGSQSRAGSFVARRVVGSGLVQLTLDNGATWTTVTLTTAFAQLGKVQVLANSQFGIRLVTNGDVIDVDYTQNESGVSWSSPTIGARAADTLSGAFNALTQSVTIWLKAIDRGTQMLVFGPGTFEVGAFGTNPSLIAYRASTSTATVSWHNGTAQVAGTPITSPAVGQLFEEYVTLTPAGVAQYGVAIAGGALQQGAAAAVNALPALTPFGASVFRLNKYTGVGNGYLNILGFRIAAGVPSFDAMRLGGGAV
jgi:hypothetical protein